jgi:hypothetical protein
MKKTIIIAVAWVLVMGVQAQAMPGMGAPADGQPPHSQVEVGRIEGTLLKDGKPQAGKDVVIQVEQGGQTLLTLPKKTDEKGQFVFKNIFKDPQYHYFLLAEDGGKVYRHGPLQLTGKQESLKTIFALTPEHVVEMGGEPLPPESPRAAPVAKLQGQWEHYQVVTIFLSVLILVVMAYSVGRYQRKK